MNRGLFIPVSVDLLSNHKTIILSELLGRDRLVTTGLLVSLWAVTQKEYQGGCIGQNPVIIEKQIGWKGKKGKFIDACVEAGFIEVKDNQYFIHDWDEYGGKLQNKKTKNAERMRNARCSARAAHVQRTCNARAPLEKEKEEEKEKEYPLTPFLGESETEKPVSDDGDLKKPKTAKKTKTILDPIAQEIWDSYPSVARGGKPEVEKALRKAEKLENLKIILSAVQEYARSPYVQSRLNTPDVNTIPLLATWLNKGRWNQDRAAWKIPRSGNGQRAGPEEEELSAEAMKNIKRTVFGIIKKLREENRESEIPEQIRNHLEKLKMTQEEFEDECRTRIAAQSRSREESSGSLFSSDDSSKS